MATIPRTDQGEIITFQFHAILPATAQILNQASNNRPANSPAEDGEKSVPNYRFSVFIALPLGLLDLDGGAGTPRACIAS